MARVTTVKTAINSDTSEAVTVDSTSWSTDSGTITLSSAVPAVVKVGDIIADSATNSYLITGISGSVLTCQDFDTTTDPVTGNATISEAYATITLWEADLDSGTNSQVYVASDDAQGECYNNGAFDESVTINGGGTIGLSKITLIVPASERHDGTVGTGARINRTTGQDTILEYLSSINGEIGWLEITGTGAIVSDSAVKITGGAVNNVHHLILHSLDDVVTRGVDLLTVDADTASGFNNNIIYAIKRTITSSLEIVGLTINTVRRWSIQNNTIHDVGHEGGSSTGNAFGIIMRDDIKKIYQNLIVIDTKNPGSGSLVDYSPSILANATATNNLSSDATASGTGSLINKTSANQFVSNSAPYDLHLKTGADAIDAGVDLVTTPTGVEIDIDGWNRDSDTPSRDPWDMGAHEFEPVAVGGILIYPGMSGGMQIMAGGIRG